MPLNLARFLSDPRLYHLLLYCIPETREDIRVEILPTLNMMEDDWLRE